MPESSSANILDRLYGVVASRRGADPRRSHVAKLLGKGTPKIAKKVGEEAVEVAIAAMRGEPDEIVDESADLLFHLLVLWADADVRPAEVLAELERREGISGFDLKREKRKRKKGSVS